MLKFFEKDNQNYEYVYLHTKIISFKIYSKIHESMEQQTIYVGCNFPQYRYSSL